MRFDYTHGEKARYMVSIYAWNVNDHYYFHSFKDASQFFEKAKKDYEGRDYFIGLNDLRRDIRKDWAKV